MAVVVILGLSLYAGLQVLIELAIVAWLRTGEIGCGSPVLAEWNQILILLVHHAYTEESVTALAEQQRLGVLNHTLVYHQSLPLLVAGQVVEECGCHLTEVATAHLHRAYILQVIQLLIVLTRSKAEGLDSLVGIVLAERVILVQAECLGHDGAVGSIGPGGHSGTACLEHHAPVGTWVGNTLRVSLAIADRQEEVDLVAGLVQQVGYAVAALADTQLVFVKLATRKYVWQQHVVDVADVSQMAVPVECIRVAALDIQVYRVARQTMLPED